MAFIFSWIRTGNREPRPSPGNESSLPRYSVLPSYRASYPRCGRGEGSRLGAHQPVGLFRILSVLRVIGFVAQATQPLAVRHRRQESILRFFRGVDVKALQSNIADLLDQPDDTKQMVRVCMGYEDVLDILKPQACSGL